MWEETNKLSCNVDFRGIVGGGGGGGGVQSAIFKSFNPYREYYCTL